MMGSKKEVVLAAFCSDPPAILLNSTGRRAACNVSPGIKIRLPTIHRLWPLLGYTVQMFFGLGRPSRLGLSQSPLWGAPTD